MNAGERRAFWHYRLRGYRILGTNVRAGRNELDLIVRRGATLLFVEVKRRSGTGFGGAVAAVDAEKRRNVRRAAQIWLTRNPQPDTCRSASRSSRCRAGACSARDDARAGVEPGSARTALRRRDPGFACWRRIRRHGGYTGIALRRPRPRALVVRARAAGAGAHEARASPASIPRQVHPTARPDAAGAPRARGGRVLDPFAGSGTTLVQALESGHDAAGVDIAGFNAC